MQLILLSGGSGKRLWPLSNGVRSKQFLKLLTDDKGNRQSMVQRVFAQINTALPKTSLTIATNATQVDSIRNQLGADVNIVIEPEHRDTYPAIALACEYLASEKNIERDETVVVLPCDPYTEVEFFTTLTRLREAIASNLADISLIGVEPQLPTSKYGYIVPQARLGDELYSVSRFVEKPTEDKAAELIRLGAFWNGGVFAFKLGYVLDIVSKRIDYSDFFDLRNKYTQLEKISFDYKVVEKAERVAFVPYRGKWADIGTWRTVTSEMPASVFGNVTAVNTRNTFVINELNIPIVALGVKNVVIAASPDGILVSDIVESSQLKPVVGNLDDSRPMYEERYWGEYTVISRSEDNLVKLLSLEAGKSISYQSHKLRDEIWVVTLGKGILLLEGTTSVISVGDNVKILRNQKHKITAISHMRIIEVQLGDACDESDIEWYDSYAENKNM
jgi:mannose-1-phosphate guanylyltransferase